MHTLENLMYTWQADGYQSVLNTVQTDETCQNMTLTAEALTNGMGVSMWVVGQMGGNEGQVSATLTK